MKMVVLYNAQNTYMIVSRNVHLSISTTKIGNTWQSVKMSMCMLLKRTHFVNWKFSQDLQMKGSLHPNAIGLTSYVKLWNLYSILINCKKLHNFYTHQIGERGMEGESTIRWIVWIVTVVVFSDYKWT